MLKRLPSSLYCICTPSEGSRSLWERRVTVERNMLKMVGARTHPCLTPTSTLKNGDCWPPTLTQACIPSWNCRKMFLNFGGTPSFPSTSHSSSRLTVSKALDRSMKARYRSLQCSLHFSCTCLATKIMSAVLRCCLKPHWDSGRTLLVA